ncbi:MAG TPA: GNAT family N-acetyltransferase [Acidimicrobiales bacterium]|nr:GNAT family N-acetyltransferase [Acidimicrobiales bacterium]
MPRDDRRVLLSDGRGVLVRRIHDDDVARLRSFHDGLSAATVRNRFLSPHPHLSLEEARHFTDVDEHSRAAVVALDGDRIVGVGRFEPTDVTGCVELGLVVDDAFQHLGLGSWLLAAVVRLATLEGHSELTARVLSSNAPMLRLLLRCGLDRSVRHGDDVTEVTLVLPPR